MDNNLNIQVSTEVKLYHLSAVVEIKANGVKTSESELFICNLTPEQFDKIIELAKQSAK